MSEERRSTTLLFNDPTGGRPTIEKGTNVIFTGKLVCGNQCVAGAKIDIYDSDKSFMIDDLLASGTTKSDGTFAVEWKAKEMDWFDTVEKINPDVEVYAKFKGNTSYKPSESKKYVIVIKELREGY